MVTCLGDMFYPEVGERIVQLLRRLGVTVEFPAGQTCCGLPLFNSGHHREAAAVARRTVGLFEGVEHVVVPSGSCAWMVKHEYPGLMADAASRAAAERLASRTRELSQFLVGVLGRRAFRSAVEGTITYHDSCHLLRGLHESESPRALLRDLAGARFVEMAGADECCGFGGSFSVRLPEVSTAILDKKLANVEASGAACVVACDAGCLMQMRGGLSRRRLARPRPASGRGPRRRSGHSVSDPDLATPFRERASRALGDHFLQEALTIATTKFITLRQEAFDDYPEGEALRDRARAIKEATLQHLDQHLERLIDNVERRGGHVHYATTAEDARRIVLDIARRSGARLAVKSKSMATEEIHLNEALEAAGVTPIETDLGEYIIQLAHERPSHIIAPAIHKTKGQVAELFARELKRETRPDPEMLTRIAREELREKFLQADLGITGANFAVAETGTVVLVTNEGNGRMATSLPRVHVAVMGVEKVVPSMTDLAVFLAILAKSATGQKLSVYTSLVDGPRRSGELEGPEELHLVLLDNGRIKQIAGTLREALYCLRCGACLNVCPVYRQIGGHAYGYTYPGPIGILLTAMLEGPKSVKDLAHASSLCGACADACPVRIDIPRMLIELRKEVADKRIAPWPERVVFAAFGWVLRHPPLYRLAAPIARLLQRPFTRGGRIQRLPLFFGDWTRTRDLPVVASRTFQERWAELERSR